MGGLQLWQKGPKRWRRMKEALTEKVRKILYLQMIGLEGRHGKTGGRNQSHLSWSPALKKRG